MVTPGIQVIGPFPPEIQRRIRRRAIRDCHKWDPQVGDTCTVGAFAVSLSQEAWAEIRRLVEQLAAETLAAEREIQQRPELFPRLGIPRALRPLLHRPPETPDPPACRRLGRGAPRPGMYDNRSVLLPQDVPSARRLKAAGIRSITLIQAPGAVAKDLSHLLYAWQQGGLHLLRTEPFSTAPPEPFHLRKPLGFGSMLHDLMVRAGLRRSSQGGFGGTVPLPQQSGTGYHSYGRMG